MLPSSIAEVELSFFLIFSLKFLITSMDTLVLFNFKVFLPHFGFLNFIKSLFKNFLVCCKPS